MQLHDAYFKKWKDCCPTHSTWVIFGVPVTRDVAEVVTMWHEWAVNNNHVDVHSRPYNYFIITFEFISLPSFSTKWQTIIRIVFLTQRQLKLTIEDPCTPKDRQSWIAFYLKTSSGRENKRATSWKNKLSSEVCFRLKPASVNGYLMLMIRLKI